MSATVLVSDAEHRSALAVVRSLGAAGYRVLACGRRKRTLAGASRFAGASFSVVDPLSEPVAFAERVAAICAREGVEIFLPVTDASLLATLEHEQLFRNVILPVRSEASFRNLSDKAALLRCAEGLGIATPRRQQLAKAADAESLPAGTIEFPLVVKPARSVYGDSSSRGKGTVRYAGTHEDLLTTLRALPAEEYPVMLQQRIVGPGTGVFLLLREGVVQAAFSHRRLREKPPSGGVCVYGESVRLDPVLVSRSADLLRAFGWEGVAMVEFKIDARTGTPYLMEVNARFWGSLQLAVAAGVDFPRLLVEQLQGRRVAAVADYKVGTRVRWFWGDVDHLIARWRNPGAGPEESAGRRFPRARALMDFVGAARPGVRSDVFRFSDPLPFLVESWNWIRRVA